MRGSFSARIDALSLKAPTLRSALASAPERSVVGRRSKGEAVVKGRLRASAARAAVYHLARERCSAVVPSGRWSGLLGEKVGARSVIFPTIYTQELPGIYSQENPGATRVFQVILNTVTATDSVPLEGPDTYDFKALSADNSANRGT